MAKRLLLLVGLLALIPLSAAAGLASGFLLGQARAAPPGRPGEGAALLGVAAFSDAGGPHWELLAPARLDPAPAKRSLSVRRWLLLLPADPSAEEARPRDGWLCLVRGRVSGEPNPWGLPVVEAERAVPLAPASWALRRDGIRRFLVGVLSAAGWARGFSFRLAMDLTRKGGAWDAQEEPCLGRRRRPGARLGPARLGPRV